MIGPHRLYPRLALGFLAIFLLASLVSIGASLALSVRFRVFRRGPGVAEHLARILPRPGEPRLARALQSTADELGLDLAVVRVSGEMLARGGAALPEVSAGELERLSRHPGWTSGDLVGAPLGPRPSEAVLLVRLPPSGLGVRWPWPRMVGFAILVLVALALVVPLSRSITQPIGKLVLAAQRFGDGDFSARSGVASDDELGRLGKAFDAMAERIERARRAEKELLANLSHELRTPLSRLRVALELVAPRNEALDQRISQVEEEVSELDRLIGDVLTASRLDLAQLPLRRSAVELRRLLDKALERQKSLGRSLRLSVEAPPGFAFEADEALVARAIDILLDNAHKYGDQEVALLARGAGNRVEIAVTDQGPGIPESERERIFEPFYRGTGARSLDGFGLGLALARRIARAHGGELSLETPPQGGARFVLSWGASGAHPVDVAT